MGSLPEPAYISEIPKLKNYPNIRTLGYVATNYTEKALDSGKSEDLSRIHLELLYLHWSFSLALSNKIYRRNSG